MNTYYQNCPFPKPINKKRKRRLMGIRTSITAAVITAEPMGQNVTRCTEAPTDK